MFNFIKRVLFSQRGTASVAKAEQYQNFEVLGRAFDGSYLRGRMIGVAIDYVVGTATYTTGSSDTVSGTVKLFTHKAGWTLMAAFFSTDGLSASAGVGQSTKIGDGSDDDYYMLATDWDAAALGTVAPTAIGAKPTADKTVTITYGATGTPVAGQHIYVRMIFMAP